MKRYILFGGSSYYPYGGADDFIACFDDQFEAIKFGCALLWQGVDWWHVFDIETGLIVQDSDGERNRSQLEENI